MKIPAYVILEALSSYMPDSTLSSDMIQFTSVRILSNQALDSNILYVGLAKDLKANPNGLGNAFISIGKPTFTPDEVIILPDDCSLFEVFNLLQNIFDSFSAYEIELLKTLESGTYQDLINVSFQFIGNPIYFMDSSYRIHALTPNTEFPNYPELQHVHQYGFVSFEAIKLLKNSGNFDAMRTYKGATLYSTEFYPGSSIITNLKIDSIFAGRLIVMNMYKPFSQAALLASNILAEVIEIMLSRDKAFQHIHGKDMLDKMFHDLVYGVCLHERLINDRLQYLPGWNNGFFRVLAIPLGSSYDQTFDYYVSLLNKHIDAYSILYENTLIATLHYCDKNNFSNIKAFIFDFLSDHNLIGGVSNEFSNLSELLDYYNQAVISFELGKNERRLNLYSEYILKNVLSILAHEKTTLLCHPSVTFLKQYDIHNNTELLNTLQAYLENERSLVKTANALYIHRNTLLYRIKKINSLLRLDLDDAELRLHLLLSYKILSEKQTM